MHFMDIKDRDKLIEAFDHMVDHVSEAMHNAEEVARADNRRNGTQCATTGTRNMFTLTQEEAESLGVDFETRYA